jgi:2,4-dienoyl-CoA reductase-like NADH-dependent reductase (Old Yellow Enzyme family)
VQAFKEAADRSLSAGFDICEVHGAHGYLIRQFLSPVTNRRTDGYGGDRAGRMRFALEVAEAVRKAWPASNPLFFRVSAVDGKGGRWSIEDTLDLSRSLTEYGVDVIDCSSGGITGDSDMPALSYSPGYQVGFAERIRRDVETRTMAASERAIRRLAERRDTLLIAATDNNRQGDVYADRIRAIAAEMQTAYARSRPRAGDWNEDLMSLVARHAQEPLATAG